MIEGSDGLPFDAYITVGEYDDGSLGEVFVRLGRSKSDLIQGLIDAWAITFSIALQHGADFEMLVEKLAGMKFQPAGRTDHESVPHATSIIDFAVRWMALRYGSVRLIAQLDEGAESAR